MRQIKVVVTKHNKKQNIGKGFSTTELEKAGVNKQQARKIGLPIDVKRKTAHDQNIATIKECAETAKTQAAEAAAKAEAKKAEAKPKPKKKAKS